MKHPLVVAITGASGAVYAARLLQQLLLNTTQKIHVVMSDSGRVVVDQELKIQEHTLNAVIRTMLDYRIDEPTGRWAKSEWTADILARLCIHDVRDYMTPIASGSYRTSGMVICPCSGSTLSGVVHASGRDLIQRAADVHLKEGRRLILVPRETPLSVFQLENMQRAATAGARVLPAMPGWYHGVRSVVDLVDFVVARILDQLEVEHTLMKRWCDPDSARLHEAANFEDLDALDDNIPLDGHVPLVDRSAGTRMGQ